MMTNQTMASAKLRAELDALALGDVDRADEAERHIHAAATAYRNSLPIVDDSNRRSRPSISTARSSVAELVKHLDAAIVAARDLPVNAKTAVAEALDAPVGTMIQDLGRMAKVANEALGFLRAEPDKPRDDHRAILAFYVARIFKVDLGLEPAATRDTNANITGARGGAAYARVLRVTFDLAGVQQIDLGPVMDRGLDMLKDPDLPVDLQL